MAPTVSRSDGNDRDTISYDSQESRQDSLRRMAGQLNTLPAGGEGERGKDAVREANGPQEQEARMEVVCERRRGHVVRRLPVPSSIVKMLDLAGGLLRHTLSTLGWLITSCLHLPATVMAPSIFAATTKRARNVLTRYSEVERRAEISHAFASTSPRSPDTASPIYPERAIRPLPKSRLKSKLSPGQAETLVFPPEPPPVSPTLNFSLSMQTHELEEPRLMTNGEPRYPYDFENVQRRHHQHQPHSSHCTCGEDVDSGEEEVEFDHPDYRYAAPPAVHGVATKPVDSLQRRLMEASRSTSKPPPPGSVASSADGYESFENTSNKKKRKIPLSGTSSMHQSQLSAEMASMGINSGQADGGSDDVNAQQYGQGGHGTSPGSGTGISGAGRGRYGRQDGRIRRPLGSSTMNVINGYTSRAPARDVKHGEGKFPSPTFLGQANWANVPRTDLGIENTGGIISQAIKTAAEQGPLNPAGRGRDNISLLHSATAASATPKTQFTFTCESDSATKMLDQQAAYAAGTPTPQRSMPPGVKGAGTQTTPSLRGVQHSNNIRNAPPPPSNHIPAGQHSQAPPPKPKPRRNPAKEYALQAANRKKTQQYQNYHHRPKHDDMWICEFCEYEDIYGAPPYAMIRKYEIKDRQERKKAAEKRRLLEKAKMKGRKNKKGAAKKSNNTAAVNTNNHNANHPAATNNAPRDDQLYDPNLPPPDHEEYYDDDEDYADEYEAVPGVVEPYPHEYYSQPPAPVGTPVAPAGGGEGRG